MTKTATGTWGGKRSGAGRPRVTLAQLVESRSFNPESDRHRRLLETDELPAEWEHLRELQDSYRRNCQCHSLGPVIHLARRFADDANGWGHGGQS